MAGACGRRYGDLGGGETVQGGVVVRHASVGAAGDLEVAYLGTDVFEQLGHLATDDGGLVEVGASGVDVAEDLLHAR